MLALCYHFNRKELNMATLSIRKLDDRLYERLGLRAKSNNRSLEAEVRDILEGALPAHDSLISDLRNYHAKMRALHKELPDSTPLIRAIRDEE
jgi:plasmid stability protein